jgi:hypothetical protein
VSKSRGKRKISITQKIFLLRSRNKEFKEFEEFEDRSSLFSLKSSFSSKRNTMDEEEITMTDEAVKARRAYMAAWREKNRQRLNEYRREYYAAHRDEIREKDRAWRAANGDKIRKYRAAYWDRKAEQ